MRATKVVLFSGRVPWGIIDRVVKLGAYAIISPGAPTDMSINTAGQNQIMLVGFAKNGEFNIYAHEELFYPMGRRRTPSYLLMRGSFANGMIAEPPRIEGERVNAVGEGAAEQANVATRGVFDDLRSGCAKIQDEGNE